MGLLKHLLFWPVTGPQFLIDFSLRQIEGVVEQELTDDTGIKAELMELQLLLELGDIDDEEYARREAALMLQLREIRAWRERLGMGVSGGLVRVAGSGGEDTADREPDPAADAERPGGEAPRIADPGGASVDIRLDWE